MADVEELRLAAKLANERYHKAEAAIKAVENKKLVGKCFRYRNCYSCPEKPSDYWWLYMRVTKADGYWLYAQQFQVDKNGACSFDPKRMLHNVDGNYEPITKAAYDKAWKQFEKAFKAPRP